MEDSSVEANTGREHTVTVNYASECAGHRITRRRWTDREKCSLMNTFARSIATKTLPSGKAIAEFASQLGTRSVPQIRTQLHNIISGKLSMKLVHWT